MLIEFRSHDPKVDSNSDSKFDSAGHTTGQFEMKSSTQKSMSAAPVLTIDGPAASGKSSVSRELARRFGWNWVSTGVFYRGIAWAADHLKLNLDSEADVEQLAKSNRWSIRLQPEQTCFLLDGVDRTEDIGKEAVGALASKISSYPKVRLALLSAQRACATANRGLVAEGRDCGSVVFPAADVKVFLTARAEDRAARRARDEGRDVESMISEQKLRDTQDASRKTAPMLAPEGAHTVDTTGLSFNEVVESIEAILKAAGFTPIQN